NADPSVHGILVQLPLPPQINPHTIIAAVDPAKDVDGFSPVNAGRLAAGLPALAPCTPVACILLAKTVQPSLMGLETVVIGRSNIVGKPLVQLLLAENATVTVAHSKTRELPALCRRADVLFAAVGRPEMVRRDWVKPGATVIDIGVNRVMADGRSRIVGDVAFAEVAEIAGAITPVPGGVGPMTIACLLANTVRAACALAGLREPAFGQRPSDDREEERERPVRPSEGDLVQGARAEAFGRAGHRLAAERPVETYRLLVIRERPYDEALQPALRQVTPCRGEQLAAEAKPLEFRA